MADVVSSPTTTLLERHRAAAAQHLPPVRIVIGDEERTSGSGGVHEHVNPSTGQVQAELPLAGPKEIDDAVKAARAGLKAWKAMQPTARRDVLIRFAQLMRKADWVTMQVLENGQSSGFAAAAAEYSHQYASYYASWADRIEGTVSAENPVDGRIYTRPEPLGVVAVIITWNAPHLSLAMKLPAILAAGNTVVLKPAEITPFSAMRWVDLAREAGFPDGVLNVVTGSPDAGRALVEHPGLDKITFTGGPPTARSIMRAAADTLTPVLMELGGKGANLLFADANLDECVPFACVASTFIAGQGCALPTRMLVQREIYDEVLQRVQATMATLTVGDPLDPANHSGPVVSQAALERILGVIEAAKAQGSGRLLCGGSRLGGELGSGYFIEHTVFADVDPGSSLTQQEIFGPVLAITPFDTEEQAVELANGTPYGLTNYLQTTDARRVRRLVPELRAGTIGVNGGFCLHPTAPFGGVGTSGFGYEGGKPGLDEFIRYKAVIEA
ncbi:MAG TPA: aldehyde dehydrogenase family protein [Solirubrobacteraceae bacterium]|jgi:aldehyde dehydrogenase (NAD+)|nr:aldehyde dehydrogenase family protein [Solirubrobacteraceae bacterium]